MNKSESYSVQAAVRQAAEFGTRPAVGLPNHLQSFEETYERTLRLATALEQLGAGPGSRVGILASNGPWFFELYFAACEAGFVECPLNQRFTSHEQERYLMRIEPEFVLVSPGQVAQARELQERVSSIKHLVGIGAGHGLALDYEELLKRGRPDERPLREVDEPVLISSTSGTTGDAKAVVHTQATTASAYRPLIERFELSPDDHIVTGLAMYFATAYAGWTFSFVAGAQHTILPAYDPARWVEAVEATKATHGFLGPTPVYLIMDDAIDLHRLSSLRSLSMGGARADENRIRSLVGALGERVCVQFGMTELGAGTTLLGREFVGAGGQLLPAHSSVGRPVAGLEVRLIDDEGEDVTGAQTPGEMQLRGPMVSPGYLEGSGWASERTHDGWFPTGDVARMDDDGFIYIVDRKKDLIVTGGINVAPSEVEKVLTSHPAVLEAGAFGLPDDKYGEAVHAAVVLSPGTLVSERELVDWCRSWLSSVKKPQSVKVVDQLPLSSTGKLARRELRLRFLSDET